MVAHVKKFVAFPAPESRTADAANLDAVRRNFVAPHELHGIEIDVGSLRIKITKVKIVDNRDPLIEGTVTLLK